VRDMNEVLLHPVRARIVQHLSVCGRATPGDLALAMADVPRTTLYRHINVLTEHDLLSIVSEAKVRGTLERTYGLNLAKFAAENTVENGSRNAFGFLMQIYAGFDRYFSQPDADPKRDLLFLQNIVCLLTDQEFHALLAEYSRLLSRHLDNRPAEGRKPRNLALISWPTER